MQTLTSEREGARWEELVRSIENKLEDVHRLCFRLTLLFIHIAGLALLAATLVSHSISVFGYAKGVSVRKKISCEQSIDLRPGTIHAGDLIAVRRKNRRSGNMETSWLRVQSCDLQRRIITVDSEKSHRADVPEVVRMDEIIAHVPALTSAPE